MSEIKFHSPSQILDAENAIDDLNIMTGYIWAIGAKGGVFPSEHFIELNEYYHEKYFKELEHKLELAKEELDKYKAAYNIVSDSSSWESCTGQGCWIEDKSREKLLDILK